MSRMRARAHNTHAHVYTLLFLIPISLQLPQSTMGNFATRVCLIDVNERFEPKNTSLYTLLTLRGAGCLVFYGLTISGILLLYLYFSVSGFRPLMLTLILQVMGPLGCKRTVPKFYINLPTFAHRKTKQKKSYFITGNKPAADQSNRSYLS